MSGPARTVAETLAASPLAGLLDRARLLERLSAAVSAAAAASGVDQASPPKCHLQGQTLLVTAASTAHAAKLRQCAARITEVVQELAPEVNAIRFRVQPGAPIYHLPGIDRADDLNSAVQTRRDPADAAEALRFADNLASSLRDSPLRQSAQRLQARLRAIVQRRGR